MNWWQALILGIVEGLTEYLPVSSTGHLILAQRAMGLSGEAADAYAICIQAGAIVAVLGLYFQRVKQGLRGLAGKDPAGLRLVINLLAGFVPAAVIGLALNDLIKEYLFGIWPVVAAWFVGGVAILVVSRWKNRRGHDAHEGKTLDELTWKLALVIGVGQCVAMWPGVSRSLITIVFGMIVGLRLAAAVEFSFLLGVVTLGAATCYDALKHGKEMLHSYGPMEMALGALAAFVSAVIAVRWMVAYLNKHGMAVFGYYRIALAVVVAALVATGVLSHV